MKSNNNVIGSSLAEAGLGLSSSLRKLLEETRSSAKSQLGEATKDAEHQVFGLEAELKEGDEVSLEDKPAEKKEKKQVSAEHQAYFREILTAPKRKEHEDSQQLREELANIRIEIKKLQDTSVEMKGIFREISTQDVPEKPGKYHLTFYEWVFITIRNTREKMEEVNTLGAMFQNRVREKLQYKSLSNTKGTKYSMSNELSIARQNG